MREIDKIIVHCSDTPDDRDITVDDIRKWHVEDNGWSDIGYHYIINRNGDTMCGRPVGKAGAHVKGHNKQSIGVCLIGRKEFNKKQFDELKNLIGMLNSVFPDIEVYGHRDFDKKKTCPNFDVKDVL